MDQIKADKRATKAALILSKKAELKLTPRMEKIFTLIVAGYNLHEVGSGAGCSWRSVTATVSQVWIRYENLGKVSEAMKARYQKPRLAAAKEAAGMIHFHKARFTERELDVLELLTETLTYQQIADKLNISKRNVRGVLHSCRKKLQRDEAKLTHDTSAATTAWKLRRQQRREEAVKYHNDGLIPSAIAREVGLAESTVRQYLRELGLEYNQPRTGWSTFSQKEADRICNFTERSVLKRRMARGMTVDQMAAEDNAPRSFIINQMSRLEIEIPQDELWVWSRGSKVRYDVPVVLRAIQRPQITPSSEWKSKGPV